jgi:hypothetical protein
MAEALGILQLTKTQAKREEAKVKALVYGGE